MTMAGILQFYQPTITGDRHQPTQNFSEFLAVFCFCMVALLLALCLRIMAASPEKLDEEKFKNRFDFLYSDQIAEQMKHYSVVFVCRRIFSCLIFLQMTQVPGLQVQITLLMNLLISIYVGTYKPFIGKLINNKEIINEAMIFYLTINLVVFTNFVDEEIQY